MKTAWEKELATFLTDLLRVQDETIATFGKKRELLKAGDAQGLAALGGEEAGLIEKLQECLNRREVLLRQAREEGLPADSIRTLTQSLPKGSRRKLTDQAAQVSSRTRLLQHHSLTSWVVVQRTLIHLSQMLEIIATGGKLQPTYGKSEFATSGGNLVDKAA